VSEYFSLQHDLISKYNDDPEKIDSKYIEFVEHFFEPRCGKYSEGRDITTLHNIIIKCAADMTPQPALINTVHNSAFRPNISTAPPAFNFGELPNTNAAEPAVSLNAENSRYENYAVKYAAVTAVRLIANELTDLCTTVDTCSRPVKSNVTHGRKRMYHRKRGKNINFQGEYK
jgi:hypothetical protein